MKRTFDTIKKIGDLAIDSLFAFDDYDIDGDEYGLYDVSVRTSFDLDNGCNVECDYSYHGGSHNVEIRLNPSNDSHYLVRLEEAVNEYVGMHLDMDDLKERICDQAKEDCEDEWQRNGFRDAADYYHWRYA